MVARSPKSQPGYPWDLPTCLIQLEHVDKDSKILQHVSSQWNNGSEKNGPCAGGTATDWKRGVQAQFVNIFAANDKTITSGCTTYV